MRHRISVAVLVVGSVAACAGGEDSTLRRGDEAFARGDVVEAIAEYRLALRQDPGEPEALLRVARASAQLRRVDDAVNYYRELVALEPKYESQAITEFLALAADAADRGDSREMALAVEAALALEPAIGVGGLAEPLGAFYSAERRWAEALVFLGRAVRSIDISERPALLYDLGLAYQGVGDCARAIPLFEDYGSRVPPSRQGSRGNFEYLVGGCSLDVAQAQYLEEDFTGALESVERMIELQSPPTRIGAALLLQGDVLSAMGRCVEAEAVYQAVIENPRRWTGRIVSQARSRSNAIRFPASGRGRRRGGACS